MNLFHSCQVGQFHRGAVAAIGLALALPAAGAPAAQAAHRGGSDPAWSPFATKLAFIRKPPRGPERLYVARADGRALRRLATRVADNPGQPSWSPDGRQIAYTSLDGNVSVQRLDGSGLRQVAGGGVNGTSSFGANSPDWQPVGQRVSRSHQPTRSRASASTTRNRR